MSDDNSKWLWRAALTAFASIIGGMSLLLWSAQAAKTDDCLKTATEAKQEVAVVKSQIINHDKQFEAQERWMREISSDIKALMREQMGKTAIAGTTKENR